MQEALGWLLWRNLSAAEEAAGERVAAARHFPRAGLAHRDAKLIAAAAHNAAGSQAAGQLIWIDGLCLAWHCNDGDTCQDDDNLDEDASHYRSPICTDGLALANDNTADRRPQHL